MNEYTMIDRDRIEVGIEKPSVKTSIENIKRELEETCILLDGVLNGLKIDETKEEPIQMEAQCMQQDVNIANMLAGRCLNKAKSIREILF